MHLLIPASVQLEFQLWAYDHDSWLSIEKILWLFFAGCRQVSGFLV